MLKLGLKLVAVAVLVLSLSGCAGGPDKVEANLGQEFSLSVGQSALITGEDLEITFEKVLEDSRCAKDVTCVWEGRVSCIVELTISDSPYQMVLTEPGLTDQYAKETYEDYQLTFHVMPYPEAEKRISEDEYQLLLIVNKRSN